MKIAIDARIINSSTGRYVERLLHYLEQIDSHNDYLIFVPSKDLSYYQPTNPRFKLLAADFPSYSLSEQVGFLSFLNNLQADLVHFCMPQQPILYRGAHVTTVHDLILLSTYNSDKNYITFTLKQWVGRAVFKIIGKTSAHIMTPSRYTKDAYQAYAHIPEAKITVTYNGCDLPAVTPQPYAALQGKQYLLYVGQQSDYKNIRRLLQAHHQLQATHPDLLAVLVGRMTGKNGAPLVTNKQWAEARGFTGVVFTDFVPDTQLRWIMQHCAAYVFPSLMEGFGLPGLEAMAAGAPVASSNATCLPEVYGDGALYFDPLQVSEMVQTIDRILTDDALRRELIRKGRLQAKKYSWRTLAEQTHAIYMASGTSLTD